MTKFKVTQDTDYVQGYLKYGHREGIIEADSKEDVLDKLKHDRCTDYLNFVLDDYEVENSEYLDEFDIKELSESDNNSTSWIKFEDQLPKEDEQICVLIYEDWSRDRENNKKSLYNKPDENWIVCGGTYSTREYYIPCKQGVPGGVGCIFNDYNEGQLIYAVAWCSMPQPENFK